VVPHYERAVRKRLTFAIVLEEKFEGAIFSISFIL